MEKKLEALIGTLVTPDPTCHPPVQMIFHGFRVEEQDTARAVCAYPSHPLAIVMYPMEDILELNALMLHDPAAFRLAAGCLQETTMEKKITKLLGELVTIKPFYARAIFQGLTVNPNNQAVYAVCAAQERPIIQILVPYDEVKELSCLADDDFEEFLEIAGVEREDEDEEGCCDYNPDQEEYSEEEYAIKREADGYKDEDEYEDAVDV